MRAALFANAVERLESFGGRKVEVDYTPFTEINDLVFKGPWLAERYGALQRFVDERPDELFPITRDILVGGRSISGAEVFAAQQRLNVLKRQVAKLWNEVDILAVPTTGTIYLIDEVEADPITLNARIGTYTNFVNLADLSAVAVPSGFLPNGLPQGIALISLAFAECGLDRRSISPCKRPAIRRAPSAGGPSQSCQPTRGESNVRSIAAVVGRRGLARAAGAVALAAVIGVGGRAVARPGHHHRRRHRARLGTVLRRGS